MVICFFWKCRFYRTIDDPDFVVTNDEIAEQDQYDQQVSEEEVESSDYATLAPPGTNIISKLLDIIVDSKSTHWSCWKFDIF